MYHHIEQILLKSKIACKLDHPVPMDMNGNIVSDEQKKFGFNVQIKITRPDLGILLDKCCCNLSQKYDNN